MTEFRANNRYDAAILAMVVLVLTGSVLGNRTLVLAAVVPVGYMAVDSLTGPPVSTITATRSFEPGIPAPGEQVTVTVTVENTGDRTLSDVRLVDQVPDDLIVTAGSPRGCFALRPGDSETLTYQVVARQGDYAFDDPVVKLRPLPAVGSVTGSSPVDRESTLRCRRGVTDVPRERGSLQTPGTVESSESGTGREFHSTREYRAGDEISRIDWRQYGKTGELATINYRETRASRVIVLVDGRAETRLAVADGYPTAAELTAYAADRAIGRLAASGNEVGTIALGIDPETVDTALDDSRAVPWVPPGSDVAKRTQIGAVLDAVVAESRTAEADPRQRVADGGGLPVDSTQLHATLADDVGIVCVSPLLDDRPVGLLESLVAAGRDVTLISPDITSGERPGADVASVRRRLRLDDLRASGATVVNWHTDEPLTTALEAIR